MIKSLHALWFYIICYESFGACIFLHPRTPALLIHMLLRMMCVQCNMLLGWFVLSMFFLNNFFNDKIFARSLVLYNLL